MASQSVAHISRGVYDLISIEDNIAATTNDISLGIFAANPSK